MINTYICKKDFSTSLGAVLLQIKQYDYYFYESKAI